MYYLKALLLNALLATSVLAYPHEPVQSINERDLTRRAPTPDEIKKFLKDHCSKSVSKRSLEARAKPEGFDEIAMGEWKHRNVGGNGLWTGSLGTCAAITITGETTVEYGMAGIEWHMSLTENDDKLNSEFDKFAKDVKDGKMKDMKATLYTIDTRDSNPENDDEDMKDYAAAVEEVYDAINKKLKDLTGNSVTRWYHPWGPDSPPEMQIDEKNVVSATGKNA